MKTVEFWFDPASTYSFLAAARMDSVAANHPGVEIVWRPFLLGPIFKAQGLDNSPFRIFPAKGKNMWRDMERQAKRLAIPLRVPDDAAMEAFPRNSLLAARTAIVALAHPWGHDFVRAVYAAQFGDWLDIADPAVIGGILQSLGQDPEAILAQAQSDAVKAQLRDNTARAQALGVFGAPSFTVGYELFWGNDRLEQALEFASEAA
jgi:2-hydroxychromene-2-carboxylate isomerase